MRQRTIAVVAVTAGLATAVGGREVYNEGESFRDEAQVAACAAQLGPVATTGHVSLPKQCEPFKPAFPREEVHKITVNPRADAPLRRNALMDTTDSTISTNYTYVTRQKFKAQARDSKESSDSDSKILWPIMGIAIGLGAFVLPTYAKRLLR